MLRGVGIRVQTIVAAAQHWRLSPAQVAAEYDIGEPLVNDALGFYAAHRREIDAALDVAQTLEAANG